MRASVTPPFAVRVLSKAGYGPRPGDAAAFEALGATDAARLTAWVDQQLDPDAIDDSVCDAMVTACAYESIDMSIPEAWGWYVRRRIVDCPTDTTQSNYNDAYHYQSREELERLSMLRAVHSERQVHEMMCGFWHNHFHMNSSNSVIRELIMHFNQHVIRPNALGNFRSMLEAVLQHPSMLYYTEGHTNTDRGENEGLARKLFENFTLGIDNYLGCHLLPNQVGSDGDGFKLGYIDSDVYEAARCFTGWAVDNANSTCDTGVFEYRAYHHDHDIKFVLGTFIWANQEALQDGQDVLDLVCQHPGTAAHICKKLCQRFVSDDPPAALIASAAAVFQAQWEADDQIAQVIRHILLSADFQSAWGSKVKDPWHFAISTIRATQNTYSYAYGDTYGNDILNYYRQMGQRLHYLPIHTGYVDHADNWLNTTSMYSRLRFVNRLIERSNADGVFFCDVLALTPETIETTYELVDFWIDRLLGYALPDAERETIVTYMARGYNPTYAIPYRTNSWTIERLRMTVSLILMTPTNQWC